MKWHGNTPPAGPASEASGRDLKLDMLWQKIRSSTLAKTHSKFWACQAQKKRLEALEAGT